jgi:hypothetical protein
MSVTPEMIEEWRKRAFAAHDDMTRMLSEWEALIYPGGVVAAMSNDGPVPAWRSPLSDACGYVRAAASSLSPFAEAAHLDPLWRVLRSIEAASDA